MSDDNRLIVHWDVNVAATDHRAKHPTTIYATIPVTTGPVGEDAQDTILHALDYSKVQPDMITRVSTTGPAIDSFHAALNLSALRVWASDLVSAEIRSVDVGGHRIASVVSPVLARYSDCHIDQDGDLFLRETTGGYRWYEKKTFKNASEAARHLCAKTFVKDKAHVAAVCRIAYGESTCEQEGLTHEIAYRKSTELGH